MGHARESDRLGGRQRLLVFGKIPSLNSNNCRGRCDAKEGDADLYLQLTKCAFLAGYANAPHSALPKGTVCAQHGLLDDLNTAVRSCKTMWRFYGRVSGVGDAGIYGITLLKNVHGTRRCFKRAARDAAVQCLWC